VAYLDENTLYKLTEGNQNAFAELYNHYRIPALKFCISILKDEEESENMVHEVFIKIWERRTQIKPELNFHSYLFTCLRNMAFDHLKKVEKNHYLRQRYLENMDAVAEEELEYKEIKVRTLGKALDALSEKRKQILKLNVEEGKSYQEIAELMSISKNTVKNQLVKAKQFLRNRMDLAAM
jgi:RNA polymerase sigma-70 factor (family 1)